MDFPALYIALKTIFKVGNCYSRLQGTLGNVHRLRRKVVRILEDNYLGQVSNRQPLSAFSKPILWSNCHCNYENMMNSKIPGHQKQAVSSGLGWFPDWISGSI